MPFKQKLNPITMQFNLYKDGGSVVGSQISGYGSCETSTPTQIMAYESGYARYTNVSQLQSSLLSGAGSMITGYSSCETSSPTQIMAYESGYARYTGISGIVADAGSMIGGYGSGSATGSDYVMIATGTQTSPAMKMPIGDFKQVLLGSTDLQAWKQGGSLITGYGSCQTSTPTQIMAYESGYARYANVSQLQSALLNGAGSMITGYSQCETSSPYMIMAYESGFARYTYVSGLLAGVGSIITGYDYCQTSAPTQVMVYESGYARYTGVSGIVAEAGSLIGGYGSGSATGSDYVMIATGTYTSPAMKMPISDFKQVLLGSTDLQAWMRGGSLITGFNQCNTSIPSQVMVYESGYARYTGVSAIMSGAGSLVSGYNTCQTGSPEKVMVYEDGFATQFPISGLGSLLTGIAQLQASGVPNFLVKDSTGGIQYASISLAANQIKSTTGWEGVVNKAIVTGSYLTGSQTSKNYFLISTGSNQAPVRISYSDMKALLGLS